jgi:hypothetical protein
MNDNMVFEFVSLADADEDESSESGDDGELLFVVLGDRYRASVTILRFLRPRCMRFIGVRFDMRMLLML